MAKAKGSKTPSRAPRGKDANPRKYKKKTSPLVIDKVEYVDYKDVDLLSRFMSDRAKIRNMRVSGNDRQQQLDIANAIKIAREMALLPYAKRVASASRTRPPRDGDRRPRRDEGFESQVEGRRGRGSTTSSRSTIVDGCRRRRRRERGGLSMQVILRSDLDGLGKRGDIVDVADGHARNYLLPKGLALKATAGAVDQAAKMRRSRDLRDASDRDAATTIASTLVPKVITITAKAGAEGKLFGSVTTADIVAAVEAQTGIKLDRKSLHLDEPIKSIGEHTATASLHHAVSFPIRVEVVARRADVDAVPDAARATVARVDRRGCCAIERCARRVDAVHTALPHPLSTVVHMLHGASTGQFTRLPL